MWPTSLLPSTIKSKLLLLEVAHFSEAEPSRDAVMLVEVSSLTYQFTSANSILVLESKEC